MDKIKLDDWEFVKQFFPEGWEQQAKYLGALRRQRKIKNASDLLRILLLHLAKGLSMRETVAVSEQEGIGSISDVALLKKFKNSEKYLKWLAVNMLNSRGVNFTPPKWAEDYKIKTVNASVICEPGSTGTDWRLHYCMNLFTLDCDQFILSEPKTGESFVNYRVEKNDLLIGDRAYGRLRGLEYIVKNGAHFISRLKNKAFNIYDSDSETKMDLLDKLSCMQIGDIKEMSIYGNIKNEKLKMRLIAIKKDDKTAEKSMKAAIYEQRKKQRPINEKTIKLHRYILLISSLPENISATNIARLYRTRWQIEIAFKRLKSIMKLGHLPKKDKRSARAWLYGKLFVALLVQSIIDEANFFSPWGYPLRN